jgi:hypothetical protein
MLTRLHNLARRTVLVFLEDKAGMIELAEALN